jgi:hypothetical protein
VQFPDGYVEKCLIKERADKGKEHFIKTVTESAKIILKNATSGHVKLNYRGDLTPTIYELLKKTENRKL